LAAKAIQIVSMPIPGIRIDRSIFIVDLRFRVELAT